MVLLTNEEWAEIVWHYRNALAWATSARPAQLTTPEEVIMMFIDDVAPIVERIKEEASD